MLRETEGLSFILTFFASLLLWTFIENKSVNYDKPIIIPIENISILIDDKIAIIGHEDYYRTFKLVNDYNSIKDSSFIFTMTNEYDIFGQYNGCTYSFKKQ